MILPVLLLGAPLPDNPVLILIQPAAAGPVAPPESYVHPVWIRWPKTGSDAHGSLLLTLAAGVNWEARPGDLDFTRTREGWRPSSLESLRAHGYFSLRARNDRPETLAIERRSGGVSQHALILAADGAPTVPTVPFSGAWPLGARLVAEATDWNEVATLTARTQGRVLVVEYPPPNQGSLSRAWLRGPAWPSNQRSFSGDRIPNVPALRESRWVPGAVNASQALTLLDADASVRWHPDPIPGWLGADRWVRRAERIGPVLAACLTCAFAALYAMGLWRVAEERRSPGFRHAAVALGLLPAVDLAAARFTRMTDVGLGPIWLVAVGFLVAGITALHEVSARRRGQATGSLLVPAAIASGLTVFGDARYAFIGGALGDSAIWAYGYLAATLAVMSFASQTSKMNRCFPWLATGIGLLGLGPAGGEGIPWFTRAVVITAPLLAVGVRSPWMQLTTVALALELRHLRPEWTSLTQGLLRSELDQNATDLGPLLTLVATPSLIGLVAFSVVSLVFLSPFASHRLGSCWTRSPGRRLFEHGLLVFLVCAVLQPAVAPVGVCLALAGVGHWLVDAVESA